MTVEIYNLIKSLGEDKFNDLVKSYARNKYETWDVNIVNGPYDGGIDLVVRVDDSEIKKSIQITTQEKNYEKKLEDDLSKAEKNIKEYGYLSELQFFTPYRITKTKQNQLEKNAQIKYKISLHIIDGWKIAEDCDIFHEVRSYIYKLHNVNIDTNLDVSKDDKIIFDYLSLSKDSAEVKKHFLQFYIMSFLQDNPSSLEEEIIKGLKIDSNIPIERRTVINQLGNLLTSGKIQRNDKKYSLSKDESTRLDNIVFAVDHQESTVLNSFKDILKAHNCDSLAYDVFSLVRDLFQVNFGYELNELNHNLDGFESDIKGRFKNLEDLFKKNSVMDDEGILVKKIINAACENDYFSKVSMASLYSGLFQNNKLDRYLGEKELFVCLDTQVLLRYICIKYKYEEGYEDKSYCAVKSLIDCFTSFGGNVNLFTTIDYLSECISHLWTASQLNRFSTLDYLKKLGPSKNVFYNFYLYLSSVTPKKYSSINSFISDLLGFEIEFLTYHKFEELATSKLSEMLDIIGLSIKTHDQYSEFFNIKRDYEFGLAKNKLSRTKYAIDNDIRTAIFLGQDDRFINSNGVYSEPFLITWDSLFQQLRDSVHRNQELSSWHLYTPLKFVDRLDVMEFKVNPKNVSMNIASIIEEDFSTTTKFSSFFDALSSYFQKNDIGELSIARKLVELKDRTFEVGGNDDMAESREQRSALTEILINTRAHYKKDTSKHNFQDVISIFENPEFENELLEEITKAINGYINTADLAKKLDTFIERNEAKPTN